jgi:mannosyltransferase OCH1-like enzyme
MNVNEDKMIPKIIHYCWFGEGQKDAKTLECIASWQKHLPDYELKEWSEKDLSLTNNQYALEAYQAQKWAFVSDYFRLYALYHEGGIYLDTDVEVKKSFNDFLDLNFFIGSEQHGSSKHTGTAVIGAEKSSPLIQKLLSVYDNIHFIKKNGTFDITPNPVRLAKPLKEIGFKALYSDDNPIYLNEKTVIFPVGWLSKETVDSYAIHHFAGSWHDAAVLKNKWNLEFLGKKISVYRYKIRRKDEFKYPQAKHNILLDWDYQKKHKLLIVKGE